MAAGKGESGKAIQWEVDAMGRRRYLQRISSDAPAVCPACGKKGRATRGWTILGREVHVEGERRIAWTDPCCDRDCAIDAAMGVRH